MGHILEELAVVDYEVSLSENEVAVGGGDVIDGCGLVDFSYSYDWVPEQVGVGKCIQPIEGWCGVLVVLR